jgi:hypothetical protein
MVVQEQKIIENYRKLSFSMFNLLLLKDDKKNRILSTQAEFKRGSIVIEDSPISLKLYFKCICFNSATLKCSKCAQFYCSKECQLKDFMVHKLICGECDDFELLVRLLINGNVEMVLGLLGHVEQCKYREMIDKLYPSLLQIKNIELPTKDVLVGILAKFKRNNFLLYSEDLNVYGVGAYPLASLVNHSCHPNCVVSFKGKQLYIVAIRDIEANEEVLISYVDPMVPYNERRLDLLSRYCFDCDCEYCNQKYPISLNGFTMELPNLYDKIFEFYIKYKSSKQYFNEKVALINTLPKEYLNIKYYTNICDLMYQHIDAQNWKDSAILANISLSSNLLFISFNLLLSRVSYNDRNTIVYVW